ncbi:MAG: FAD-dependent oxidoreductase [Deltaproteobacteria bacterium]|nr:FAD-dependent oxidoreductase [Desulfitobacteriaceae bacterium]MDI6854772.1 FAD-dependent oxidoreductase [Deltaproteobacteria bacterium]
MTTYIIIGNGVAGNAAAESIRRHDREGVIHIFTREHVPFYYVPALPDYVAGEKEADKIIIHKASWYDEHKIELHLGTVVTAVDPQQKIVTTAEGDQFRYDKLLLATGSYSFVPPIRGADLPGVMTLRTMADAEAIKDRARDAKQVVLIGGGLLGLEAGNGLRKIGLKVTVVEFFPRLLPRQMDVPGAAMLQRRLEEMGFTFYLGAKTREIAKEGDRLQVLLEGGPSLPADMVLISAGVRPELALAKALGLEIDKGVKVDDHMRTGLPDIYAAGDLIEHRGRFYGIWPAAQEQGRVAGANMAGQSAVYEGTVPSNMLKVVGIDLLSAGEIDAEGRMEALVLQDEAKKIYRKVVLQDNVIVGAILLGDIRGGKEIQAAIKAKKDVSLLKDQLARPDFDFSKLS